MTVAPSRHIVDRAPLTTAVKQLLLDGTGRPGDIGRAPKPVGTAVAPELPYWILYPLDGGDFTGPASAMHADAAIPYQVTYVGEQGLQLEQFADRGRQTMLDRTPTGAWRLGAMGLVVMGIEFVGLPGMDFENTIGTVADRFTVFVTTS